MEYKLGKTKAIHWDKESIHKIHRKCIIRWEITAEIYKDFENKLPIIIVGHPIVLDKGVAVFSAIFHTKAILRFEKEEDPIKDIIKMWNECYVQEIVKFEELGKGTIIDLIDLSEGEYSNINSAHRLRDAAIERKLLNKK